MTARRELFQAIRNGEAPAVRALLEREPALINAVDDSGMTPLLTATYNRNGELVKLLLKGGAGVDIIAASALGQRDRVEELAEADPSSVNAAGPDGWLPLHLAAHFGHPDVVELLLARGADVHARSKNSMANTALHAALAGRDRKSVEVLLGHGADVNARQHGGFTALHAAALHGDTELVRLLIAHGADVSIRADSDQTALAMALQKGHQAAVELLRQHGATE